jgi:NADH-quinone oxidoreductase subunit K
MVGVVARRNLFVLYLSVELMLNGVNLILATLSRIRPDMGGASIALIMLGVIAAEAALFLALIVQLWRSRRSVDVERYRDLAQERWS